MVFARFRAGAAFALACAIVLSSSPSSAFCRTTTSLLPPSYSPTRGCYTEGVVLYWKNACIGYSVNADAAPDIPFEDAERLVDAAFATWTGVECPNGSPVGISAQNLGPVSCGEVGYNMNGGNQNVIVFRSDAWPYNDSNNTLGLTTVTFNADTGEIYDADLEINAAERNLSIQEPVPSNGFDLQSVLTHEVGHFFGLAHATSQTSTMYAAYKPGTTTLRSLSPDDVEGICTIYPQGQRLAQTGLVPAGPCDATPRRGFATTCDGTDGGGAAPGGSGGGGCAVGAPAGGASRAVAAGLVLLGAAWAARRRRRPPCT